MLAGLTAGGIATILAILVSLPLVSPHDGIFNSASVALAGLPVSLLAGLIGRFTGRPNRAAPPVLFIILWLILAVALTGAALYLMSSNQLENYLTFTLTLAAVLFGSTAVGAVLLYRYVPQLPWWSAAILIAIALTLGWTLREMGDQPSGQLELPPPASRQLPYAPFILSRDATV